MVFYGGQVIEQGCQNRFGWRWLRGLERTRYSFPNIRRNRLHSSDKVRQKACGVVLTFVQGQPGSGLSASGEPFADQCSFPKAGGGRDECQFAVQTLAKPLEQVGTADQVRPRPGDIQFRGENWRHLLSPPTTSQIVFSISK